MPFPLLLVSPPQEARFDILAKGQKIGAATYRVSDRPGGGRVTRLRTVLADGSISESLSLTDAWGAMVRSEDVTLRKGAYTKRAVDYTARGDATVKVNKGKPLVVPFDRRGSRRDPSDTWFRTVKPSPGTWALFRELNGRNEWQEVRVTYVGKQGGGNLVRQERGKSARRFILDDKGILLTFESGDLKLVRR